MRNKIGKDSMCGDVYIFLNKHRNRIKLLRYERGGIVIYAKMLDRGIIFWRMLRPLALSRKNILFCGNHDAAVRAAIVNSLVDGCKAMDVDSREWMRMSCSESQVM